MEIIEVKKDIINNEFKPCYIFVGEEVAIMDIYINKMAERIGKKIILDSYTEALKYQKSKGLISGNNCYVITDDKELIKSDGIKQFNEFVGSVIIFRFNSLDKRIKFYTSNQDIIVEFNKLSSELLANYILNDIGLSTHYGIQFAEICDNNYSLILLEEDKLKHYMTATRHTTVESAFVEAVNNDIICGVDKDMTFKFTDSVFGRNFYKCFELLYYYDDLKQNPIGILSLLYNNFRNMLLVKACKDLDITQKTGLTAWQVKLAKEKNKGYGIYEIINSMRTIKKVDLGIKTGKIEASQSLTYLVLSIAGLF